VPERYQAFASRLGNAALSIFAIHAALFMFMIKASKLLSMKISPIDCAIHFAACATASKDVEPGMGGLPLYLIVTAIAAVFFQERLVAPLRDLVRRKLLANRSAQAEPGAAGA
jgi:hypothetical protein